MAALLDANVYQMVHGREQFSVQTKKKRVHHAG